MVVRSASATCGDVKLILVGVAIPKLQSGGLDISCFGLLRHG